MKAVQSTQIGKAARTKEAQRRIEIQQATMQRRERWQRRFKSAGMPRVFLGIELWK